MWRKNESGIFLTWSMVLVRVVYLKNKYFYVALPILDMYQICLSSKKKKKIVCNINNPLKRAITDKDCSIKQ